MASHIGRENKECAGTFGLKAEVCSALIKLNSISTLSERFSLVSSNLEILQLEK